MDAESNAAANTASVSHYKENGSGDLLSHLETPAVIEDDYETALELENSNERNRMPAVEKGGNPNLDEVKVEGVEVLSGGSDLELANSLVEEGESKTEGFVDGVEVNGFGFIDDEKNGQNSVDNTKLRPVEVEAGTEKNSGVNGTNSKPVAIDVEDGMEKNPVLNDTDSKPVEVEAGTEKNSGVDGTNDGTNSKPVDIEVEDGVQKNPVLNDTNSKPVEIEVEAGIVENSVGNHSNSTPVEIEDEDATEKNEVPSAQIEKKDMTFNGNRESEAVTTTSPVLEEKDVEVNVDSIQEQEEESDLKPAVEIEKDVDVHIVGSNQNLEAVEDLKPVEVEINASDTSMVEPKSVEKEELDAAASEKGTEVIGKREMTSALAQKETELINVLAESKVVEEETNVVMPKENGVTNSPRVSQVVGDAVKSMVAGETMDTEADENKAVDGAGTQRILDLNKEEKGVLPSGQVSTDFEAKFSDGGGDSDLHRIVEPPPVPAEDSKTRETEIQPLDNGVMESGSARKISAGSTMPVSVVNGEKVYPEADGPHIADDDENLVQNEVEEEEEDENVSDQQPRVAILDSSETAKQIIKEMEGGSSSTASDTYNSYRHQMEGQIVSDSDEDLDTDEEGDEKGLFDSAALAALLKAATGGSSDGNFTESSQDSRVFSVDRPAGLGSSAAALRPAPGRSARPTLFSPSELALTADPEKEMSEEERKLHEKVEDIRVKFLRLIVRLGHTSEDTVAAQVLYRLNLAEGIRRGRQMGRSFSIESAKRKAMQLEEEGEEDLKFSCNILVLGKTGVGKSATINSIFGEEKSHTNAFQAATTSVREISAVVDGVKVRVIDTPGLRSSVMEQATNRRILSSIKKYTKKCPPDIVLYVDRLDMQTRDFNDLPLLRSITSALGASIWFNAIVALTHASSAPPEGPNGSPLSYEVFIAQRSHVVQHSIRQAASDMRLMNPVALAENHPSCRRNREGQRVLPNGQSWRPQLLLLCYSSKILAEANSLLKLQDPSPGKLFGFRLRSPPLPYLLSTLLQSRAHPKLSSDQGGDNGDSDMDLDDFSDADEEEDEYDQLPPFKPLKKSQLDKLTKEQKRAYFDEYDYRVKLFQKKQFKEEIRRLKEMKKRGKSGRDESPYGDMGEDFDQDGAPAAVPVPLPDMVLPPSFDCDVPTYRYRFLEPTSQLLTRPVLDSHGWDHDCGYDGVSLEESLAIANRFPAAIAVQITKDKKDFNIHLDSSVSAKHGENGSSLAGFDIQSVGKQLAYILRGETKFKNLKKNKTAAGISVTFLGETVATGLKVEDQLLIGKRVALVASTGTIRSQGDVAYGANLEARLREKDYPIGQALSTLGLSLMKWRGDLALGANLQSQVNIGRNSKVAVRVGLNNKRSGQITIRTSTSDHLQLALVGIIPVALSVFRKIWPAESEFPH